MLTAAQQDYLEIIYRLETARPGTGVRVTDIAAELGTRLPTVSRTIRRLTELGLVRHQLRQVVALSSSGRRIASEVVHRHDDLVAFFTGVLGIAGPQAESDACQIEHGLSADTAQRLHEFLMYLDTLPASDRQVLRRFHRRAGAGREAFRHIPRRKIAGWRS